MSAAPEYLKDRIPVIPPAVHLGEKLHGFHIEGQATQHVEGTVDSVGPGDDPGTTRIGFTKTDGAKDSVQLRDTDDFVIVAFPNAAGAAIARDLFGVAA